MRGGQVWGGTAGSGDDTLKDTEMKTSVPVTGQAEVPRKK